MRRNRDRIRKLINACAQALEHLQYLYHGKNRQISEDDFLQKKEALTALFGKALKVRAHNFPIHGGAKARRKRRQKEEFNKRKKHKKNHGK